MRIHSIESGYFKLDGGAMFGVVPKTIWNKLNPADASNLCTWSMRCLLIESGDRLILVDTGLGDKQDEKFRSFFAPHGEDSLAGSIRKAGYDLSEITDVLLTHLHFDHVGGAVIRDASGNLLPLCPHAKYWTSRKHLDWALHPNPREKASFLKENILPLREHGVLHFIEETSSLVHWLPGIDLAFVYGHTESMMLPVIDTGAQKILYCADLIPSSHHVGMPYIMSYDLRPLDTMSEKGLWLDKALAEDYLLFFEHDPQVAAARLKKDEAGRILVDQAGALSEFL